jgi:hypothetical protein
MPNRMDNITLEGSLGRLISVIVMIVVVRDDTVK